MDEEVFKKDFENIKKDFAFLNNKEETMGLELEILLHAITAIRNNPKLSFTEALDEGWLEWTK